MDALIAEQKRGTRRMMPRQCKRVLVVAAILAATLILVACSPGLRHAMARLAVTMYETFVDFKVDTTEGELRTEIETVYGFDPLPEGFKMVSQSWTNPYRVDTIYENNAHNKVIISQTISEKSIAAADVESRETITQSIGGSRVLFSIEWNIRTATVIHDGYSFAVRYIGQIEQKEFEEIVASLIDAD